MTMRAVFFFALEGFIFTNSYKWHGILAIFQSYAIIAVL
jgi:hypothetical protein